MREPNGKNGKLQKGQMTQSKVTKRDHTPIGTPKIIFGQISNKKKIP